MKYDNEESELLDLLENTPQESVAFNNEHIKKMAEETLLYNQEKKQISINIKRSDLDFVKQRANDIGISYQNIIQALIHNYSTQKITLNI